MKDYIKENFHCHTIRCHHATGSEREYIEAAIAEGITTLGFSDHIPLPWAIEDRSVMGIRMDISEAKEYVDSLKALKEEYKDRINILIGYEGEYFEKYNLPQQNMLKEIGYDYLILGQHYLLNGPVSWYCGIPSLSYEKLKKYVDICIEGLETKQYLYFAHPDLMNYIGPKKNYRKEMERLCRYCKENNIPLEINLHGCLLDRYYPNNEFFKIAGEIGNEIVFGIDCHDPSEIGNRNAYEKGLKLVEQCGITNIISLSERFK